MGKPFALWVTEGGSLLPFRHLVKGNFEIKESVNIDVGASIGGESVRIFGDDKQDPTVGVQFGGQKWIDVEQNFEGGFVHNPSKQRNKRVHKLHQQGLDSLAVLGIERLAFHQTKRKLK